MLSRAMWKYWSRLPVIPAFVVTLLISTTTFAVASTSPNYQVVETEFNSGTLDACSGQYCARGSIGDLVASGAKSGGSAVFENITGTDPLLEVIVEPGETSVGTLATDKVTTKTATIKVRNYLSGGYTVQLVGTPPKFGDHTLSGLTSPTASTPGTEQFGVNLVANNSPVIGANPVRVPSDQPDLGIIDEDYDTPNFFKYVSEDVVARSTLDWGRVDYTLTMIVNVSNVTPAGHYSGQYSVIVMPAY